MSLPRTDNKKYYEKVTSSMEKNVRNINEQSIKLINIDSTNKPLNSKYINNYESFSSQDLYEEIKRAYIEISAVQDDYGDYDNDANKQLIHNGVMFASILTPALLKYINSKLEDIYNTMYKTIESEINKIKTSYTT